MPFAFFDLMPFALNDLLRTDAICLPPIAFLGMTKSSLNFDRLRKKIFAGWTWVGLVS
jgi:hypothetical protein